MSAYRTILTVCLALFLSSCTATPVLTVKSSDMSREIKQKAPVVRKVDISQNGRYVLSGSMDSFILWDILQGKKIQTFTHEDFMSLGIAVAFSPDGKYFASGGKGTKLWDLATRQEIMTFSNDKAASIAFSPDGKYFLYVSPGPLPVFET
jgi:FOG: WD40 repeat